MTASSQPACTSGPPSDRAVPSAGYDPNTYVDVNFFGEDDTRSNLARLVAERLTKIINVPNMKDHGAAGVTGLPEEYCLRELLQCGAIAFRLQDQYAIRSLARWPASSRCARAPCLHIMDGLRGVWHGGPFSLNTQIPLLSQSR